MITEDITQIKPEDIDISLIRIDCRRWFQKTYGNTYHSVRIYHNGELLAHNPFQYGYGDQCLQTAFDLLRALNVYSDLRFDWGGYVDFNQFREDVRYNHTITDGLKRDL